MSKCYKCNVTINSNTDICPLCKSRLEVNNSFDVFPELENKYKKHSLVISILRLCSLIAICVCLFINYIISNEISWSSFVIISIICFWLTLVTALRDRKSFLKMMFAEIFLAIISSIFWDILTGWHMWSINYVFPFLCAIYSIIMLIMRIFIKNNIKDNFSYITFNSAMGLLPGILLLFDIVTVSWPSYICVITSIVILLFIYTFNKRQLKNEIKRRLHI